MEWQLIGVIKSFITLAPGAQDGKHKYRSNLLQNFNPRKCRYCNKLLVYFITFAHDDA